MKLKTKGQAMGLGLGLVLGGALWAAGLGAVASLGLMVSVALGAVLGRELLP